MWSPSHLFTDSGMPSKCCMTMLNLKVVFSQIQLPLRGCKPKLVKICKSKQKQLVDFWKHNIISQNLHNTVNNIQDTSSQTDGDAKKAWNSGKGPEKKKWSLEYTHLLIHNALCLINTTMEIASYFLYRLLICLSLPAGIVCFLQTSDQDPFLLLWLLRVELWL